MVRCKVATSTLPLACDGLPSTVSDAVLRAGLDVVRDFLRRGFHLHQRGAEAGCVEALWNAEDDVGEGACDGAPVPWQPLGILGEPQVTVRAETDDGLIPQGNGWCADRGGMYRFTLTVRDARGVVVGLPLVARETRVGGVVYRCDGPSDDNGEIHISADTRKAQAGQGHALVTGLPGIDASINLKVYEFVQARLVGYARVQERVRVEVELFRRNAQAFGDLGAWRGYLQFAEGGKVPFLRGHAPDVVPVSSGWVPAAGSGTLQIQLSFPSSLDRLLTGVVDFSLPALGTSD